MALVGTDDIIVGRDDTIHRVTAGELASFVQSSLDSTEIENLISHDNLTGVVADEHIDWTTVSDSTIHEDNLPSLTNDVLEFENLVSFPETGETGKIYIAIDTNSTYRWSGDIYILLSSGDGGVDSVNGQSGDVILDTGDISSILDNRYVTDSDITNLGNLSGTNTGDQTSSDFTHDDLTGVVADEHIDWSLTNVKNIHADNYTDTNTTYTSGDFTHDSLTGVVADEHIDWTLTNVKNIHSDNYTDTNTTYTSGDFTHDDLTGVVADEHIDWSLTNVKNIHADNYTDTNTTYTSSDFTHDDLVGFVADEHIDWSLTNAKNIHADNYTDTNTTYTSSDFTHDDLVGFVANEHIDWTISSGSIIHTNNLPAYVDDVIEFANLAGFPATGETGKIYIAIDTNKTYRWSGTVYVYITSGAVDSVNGNTGIIVLDTGDITSVLNSRYVTDSDLANLGNLSGTNTGDQDLSSYNTHIALSDEHIDWSLTNVKNIHADNYTDTNTTYTSGDFTHDDLVGFVADEHIDWSLTNAKNIHSNNYTNTTYTSGDFTHDDLVGFVSDEHIDWSLTNAKNIHSDNYTDTNTTYTSGDFTHDSLTGVDADEHIDWSLTNAKNIHIDNLPSLVNDVLEFANLAGFPATGETGKIYIALDTNNTYRWNGTVYILLSSGDSGGSIVDLTDTTITTPANDDILTYDTASGKWINTAITECITLTDGTTAVANGLYGIETSVTFTTAITLPNITTSEKVSFRLFSGSLADYPVQFNLPATHTLHGNADWLSWAFEGASTIDFFKVGATTWSYSLGSLTTEIV